MNETLFSLPAGARVLVTGATGFTGAVLTRKLAQAGLDVRAIARPRSNLDPLRDLPVRWFRGDVFDEAVVRAAMDGVAYVFHVAAMFREAGAQEEGYRRVHVDSTRHLARAALEQPDFRRFVHISTMGVHGHIESPPAHEESPYHPGDAYQRTKLEAELWIREFAAKEGLELTVLRPCGIYGPGDRRLLKVFKMALWPIFPLLGRGKCLYHLVHVDDLTDMMLLGAAHPAARNEVFLCGDAEAIPLERMAAVIAAELGHRLRAVRIPAGPFFVAADLCEAVCRPLGIPPPLYRRRVAFYTKDRSFDTRKIREKLGYRNRVPPEEGLRATARWYREHAWL